MGKIISFAELLMIRNQLTVNDKLVLATGVFDLLHAEHEKFIHKAKEQGKVLVVGLESDERTRKLKGEGRPVQSQTQRLISVSKLESVDYAFLLPENLGNRRERELFISQLKPDIYAISERSPFQAEKKRVMEKFGGKLIIVLSHNPKISTTKILSGKRKKEVRRC